MLRYAKPLAKHYNKVQWSPTVTNKIKTILHDISDKPLTQEESTALMAYYTGTQSKPPTLTERNYVIRFLYDRQAFMNLAAMGKKLLFAGGAKNALLDDVSFNEMKRYLKSLVRTKDTDFLDAAMTQMIAQFSISRKAAVIDLVNSIFIDLNQFVKSTDGIDETLPLVKWTKWIKSLMGQCDFTSYIQYKYILKTLLFFLREPRKNDKLFFVKCLTSIERSEGPSTASQLATTLLYLFAYSRNFKLVEAIWSFKKDRNLSITSSDLTSVLRMYCHFKQFSLVKSTYDVYPEAHDDQAQFDYLLVAYAHSKDWQGLQDQFNALFGIGELPNIQHYGIVMYSMARIGELESVDMLYTQLLRRELIPNYPVLQSLLLAHYKTGDLNGCFAQFELFEKYSVLPAPSTYTIMLKVFRGLNDIDGGLRLLKKMTENDKTIISETHFAILIHMCSRFTNIPIAEELFNVMINHYNINPTGVSVASLMNVYIESGLPQQALKLFREYGKLAPVKERLISVYNKTIKAYIQMKNIERCEYMLNEVITRKIQPDAEFYNVTIRYLVNLKKDFKTAEETLEKLIDHPSFDVDASHFEVIMQAYDKISYREGIFQLYRKMNENKVPVNSKILHYLIKATFKSQLQNRGDLEHSIRFLDRIMESSASRTLDITFGRLHPSIIAWPMRVIAKLYNPMKALDLFNRYKSLFYGKEEMSINSRFVVLRSLLVLSAETEQWDEFDNIFKKYLSRINQCENLASSLVKNKKLSTLFVGLLSYKIRHLVATQKIQLLPELIHDLQRRGFVIDNDSWNEAIKVMFEDSRTIDSGLAAVNEVFIHGYNLIHKHRLLKKFSQESTAIERRSGLLEQKKKVPSSFQPTLYLKSEVYLQVMEYMDSYMNNFSDIEKEVQRLIEHYPYFMKSYMMNPRTQVHGWSKIEDEHASYMERIRLTKRIVPATEF